ncbi:hypothetical protein K435DRAFT_783673 [Dendrothele bispora CBS 962.96]|uniref:Uncharacterized protein n=1 Tax=Dendrothele bispora (strain CBS 962.96) TaxID=1314807 RepID=A0A4S8L7I4_DENBC|nr:hypothetical protein K435DRAFT_783673 [Dendrothele bispora CBS 962.96]
MEVDLVKEEIRPGDDIDLTLSVGERISEYEARRKEGWRWLELVSRLEGNFKKRVIGGSMEW